MKIGGGAYSMKYNLKLRDPDGQKEVPEVEFFLEKDSRGFVSLNCIKDGVYRGIIEIDNTLTVQKYVVSHVKWYGEE